MISSKYGPTEQHNNPQEGSFWDQGWQESSGTFIIIFNPVTLL